MRLCQGKSEKRLVSVVFPVEIVNKETERRKEAFPRSIREMSSMPDITQASTDSNLLLTIVDTAYQVMLT